jgi:Outer membrane protein beta-barrel domain
LKRHSQLGWFTCVFGLSILLHAQATPTATRPGELQIGAAASLATPDYGGSTDKGPTFYATFDFTRHIGVEADVHYISIITPNDIGEDSYLVGPRYVFHYKRFHPYAKALFGIGQINLQFDTSPHTKTSHFAYAFGGGLDLRATNHINIRCFDFEYQKWEYPPHGLSPTVSSIGVAYTFH